MTLDSTTLLSSTRRWWVGLCVGLVAGAFVLAGCDNTAGEVDPGTDTEAMNAFEAASLPQYGASSFESAAEQEGIGQTISGAGSVTVFAPKDAAFDPLDADVLLNNSGLLSRVLNHHVVTGSALTAQQISDGQTVTTEEGSDLTLNKPSELSVGVGVNGAQVVTPNIKAENGVVHFIDQLILEQVDVDERLDITASLDSLNDAVADEGLDGALSGNGPYTVFAPTDNVYGPYHLKTSASDLTAGNMKLWGSADFPGVLKNHVVTGEEYTSGDLKSSNNVGSTIQSASGALSIDTTSGGAVTVDGVQVSTADIQVRNGVIHLVDDIILDELTIKKRAAVTRVLDSLVTNITEASPTTDLSSAGSYTVFAPVNAAFGSYDDLSASSDDALQNKILDYHVVSTGAYTSEDLVAGISNGTNTLTTDEGTDLTVDMTDDGVVRLNEKEVLATVDLPSSNGVVHVVSDLLLKPINARERLTVEPAKSAFEWLIEQIEDDAVLSMNSDLTDDGNTYTVLAPSNQAILDTLDTDDDGDLDGDDNLPSNADLKQLLDNHVISGSEISSGDVEPYGVEATTDHGEQLEFNPTDDGVTITSTSDTVNVSVPDTPSSNGVIHEIDGIIWHDN